MEAGSNPLPWWIAGGHALDLFVGRQTRVHGDIDVSILRSAATRLRPRFPGWDLNLAHDGVLTPWDGRRAIAPPYNSLWCRRDPRDPWRLQVLLEDGDSERWVCRRHPALTVPMDDAVFRTTGGVPYMAPQLQLLMKARETRPKDDADFSVVWPLLSADQAGWLVGALRRYYPGHPWLDQTGNGERRPHMETGSHPT